MDWSRDLTGEDGARFLRVTDMINQAISDPEHRHQASVMSLMCGTGKSSAVSIKIAETIDAVKRGQSDDGLLIVSDTKDALKRYLAPEHMPDVQRYLDENQDMISRMDADTFMVEIRRHQSCPVLLMTFARYFSLTKDEIMNEFLCWGDGKRRTCIIMDEQPPLLQFIPIGNRQIAEVDTDIRNGLMIQDPEERRWCIARWERIRDRLYDELERRSVRILQLRQEMFWQPPMIFILPEEDLRRFLRYIENSKATIEAEERNALVLLEAILHIIQHGALGNGWIKAEGNTGLALYFIANNEHLVTDIGAKVIILDGTADIAPMYDRAYVYRVPCEAVNTRKLRNLTIKIINLNTSKAAFLYKEEEIVNFAKEYLRSQVQSLREVAVFTYIKGPEKAFTRDRQHTVEHFGNVRGRNDLSTYKHIAQVGLHQKPPFLYTLEYLERSREGSSAGGSMMDAIATIPRTEVPGYLHMLTEENDETRDLMVRDVAVDLEQNIFRTAIRDPEVTEPITYYLFANTRHYSLVVDFLCDRFGGKYECQVELPDPISEMIQSIRKRQSAAHRLIDWLSGKETDSIFTKEEMLTGAEMTENQFGSIKKDHKTIAAWFQKMNRAVPRSRPPKGVYMMTEEIKMYLG